MWPQQPCSQVVHVAQAPPQVCQQLMQLPCLLAGPRAWLLIATLTHSCWAEEEGAARGELRTRQNSSPHCKGNPAAAACPEACAFMSGQSAQGLYPGVTGISMPHGLRQV